MDTSLQRCMGGSKLFQWPVGAHSQGAWRLCALRGLCSYILSAYLSDKLEGTPHIHLESVRSSVADLRVCETEAPYGTDIPETISETALRSGLNVRVANAIGTLATQARTNRRLQARLVSLADYSSDE